MICHSFRPTAQPRPIWREYPELDGCQRLERAAIEKHLVLGKVMRAEQVSLTYAHTFINEFPGKV